MRWSAAEVEAHEKDMQRYIAATEASIAHTVRYDNSCVDFNAPIEKDDRNLNTKVEVFNVDTVTALMHKSVKGKVAVLNFASYNYPGGGYIKGASAQEECLCQESNLYSVLKAFDDSYYAPHRKYNNGGLYSNEALYTPDILFKGMKSVDVITCAAPNATRALECVDLTKVEETMRERIKFVLEIAYKQGVKTLILGAYGCGVFGNDPKFVAETFKNLLETRYSNIFERVIFAVINGRGAENYEIFKKVLKPFC